MYRKHGLAYVFTRDFWLYDFKKDLENIGKNLVKSIKNLEIALNFDQENEWQPCLYISSFKYLEMSSVLLFISSMGKRTELISKVPSRKRILFK